MAKFHEDMFLWETIKETVPSDSNSWEVIYTTLEGSFWTIEKIEKMSNERKNK